jgi:hypothetical protein
MSVSPLFHLGQREDLQPRNALLSTTTRKLFSPSFLTPDFCVRILLFATSGELKNFGPLTYKRRAEWRKYIAANAIRIVTP